MALESLSWALLAWLVCVITLAGLMQGALGFGFPFVATPLVAMASDMRTAVITVLLPTLATTIANMVKTGPLWPVLRRFWMMPLYAVAGAAAGTWLFVTAPWIPYSLLLALVIFVYLNLDRFGHGEWTLVARHERRFAPLAGVTAGVFEGTANVAAPPLIIFYLALGLSPAILVQALNICFLVGKSTQLTVLATAGGVTWARWLETLPFAAIGVAAFLAGFRIRSSIEAHTFRIWVKRALFAIALVLVVQYLHAAVTAR
jgi:uncharacterized membrane protein YfcA